MYVEGYDDDSYDKIYIYMIQKKNVDVLVVEDFASHEKFCGHAKTSKTQFYFKRESHTR